MVSADVALRSGDKLGRFQLLVPIGSGGMGRVWVAREENTGRLFAIKTTLADEQAGGEFWNVLLDEARIAAQIQHRSVCTIHAFEVDEQRGVPYLVMDFSDGGSLHELLEACPEHRIEPVLAASIAALLCDGLQAAHDLSDEHGALLGVVHRDVSPQNILISTRGDVQLTDFGVAKARGRLHAATETGEIKGKLSYMAPEQVTTRDVDRRADVFALGCVLYEATVGARPFHGEDPLATLYQLLEQPLVLPSARLAGYPTGLEAIVVKALQRDPAQRYQSAEELGRALSVWIAAQGRLVTERDIAALVDESLGPRIAERARRITAAETSIDAPPAPGASEQTLGGSSASTLSLAKGDPAPKSKLKWALIAGGASLVLLLGWFGFAKHLDPSPPAVNSAAQQDKLAPPTGLQGVASASSASSDDDPVVLSLRAEPASAVLFLDDGAALPNPYKLSVQRDQKSHRLRAAAAGFAERFEEIRFDSSKEVVIALSAAPGQTVPRIKGSGQTSGPGRPNATNTTNTTNTTTRVGDLPPVVRKPPRKLDPDNPFSNAH